MREISFLLKMIIHYKWCMLGGILISFVATFANIALMATSGWFITTMAVAGVSGITMVNYFTPATIIRACAIIRTGGRYLERLINHNTTFHLIAYLRSWMYERLVPLAPKITKSLNSGDTLSRIRSDIDIIERFYISFLVPIAVAVMSSIIFVLYISKYSVETSFILAVAFIVTGLIFPCLLFYLIKDKEECLVNDFSELREQLSENLQSIDELLIYGGLERYNNRLSKTSYKIQNNQLDVNKYEVVFNNSILFISNITMLLALISIIPLFKSGVVSAADLSMILFLVLASFDAVMPMVNAFKSLATTISATSRVLNMSEQYKPADINLNNDNELLDKLDIEFVGVNFSYNKKANVFKDLSLSIKQGDKVALIGATGAGKSTIVNLMLGFWQVNSGKILVNGKEITNYNNLINNFAVLEQKPHIFSDSIKNNLLIANNKVTPQELEKACNQAGLLDFIKALPEGFDTYVGENGKELSGGQIKRLALARAILKPSRFLVLDEVSEGLDINLEKEVIDAVLDSLGDKSLLIITHKKYAIECCDEVLNI